MPLSRFARLSILSHGLPLAFLLPWLGAAPSALGAGREGKRATPPVLGPDEITQRTQEAEALLGRWLAAQNQGDFQSYMALYAPRFHGVRRSRLETAPLDRAGWAKDRGRMFAKAMKVEVADVTSASTREPWAAFDSDGDGRLEFLFKELSDSNSRLVLMVPGAQGALVSGPSLVLHRWHGCGC